MSNSVLIVDISHLTYRSESTQSETLYTSTNLPTKALYGIFTSINKILNEKPNINKIYLALMVFLNFVENYILSIKQTVNIILKIKDMLLILNQMIMVGLEKIESNSQ